MAVPKVRFGVGPKLELSTLSGCCRVDAYRSQSLQMVVALIRINHMNRPVATLEPVPNERKQHAILFVVGVEERTDMTCFAKLGAGKANGGRSLLHRVLLP